MSVRPAILVVDDDMEMLDLLDSLLSEEGYTVLTAENGVEALEATHEHLPSLILLDIHMPEMDGLQVCKELKSDETTRPIPIVMLTVAGEMSEIEKAMRYGAQTYVTKPCTREQILKIVRDILPLKHPKDWLHSKRNDNKRH